MVAFSETRQYLPESKKKAMLKKMKKKSNSKNERLKKKELEKIET